MVEGELYIISMHRIYTHIALISSSLLSVVVAFAVTIAVLDIKRRIRSGEAPASRTFHVIRCSSVNISTMLYVLRGRRNGNVQAEPADGKVVK